MSKAECYTLDLYCDYDQCRVKATVGHSHEQFTGNNKRETHAEARSYGWTLGKKDYCPVCTRDRVWQSSRSSV